MLTPTSTAAFVAFAVAQGQCTNHGSETDCCIEAAGSSLCANTSWNGAATPPTITIATNWGPVKFISVTFNTTEKKQCVGSSDYGLCIQLQNTTITKTGACGCLTLSLKLGPVSINENVGCFAFGKGNKCPPTVCSYMSDCSSCDAIPSCGYCASNSSSFCAEGTESGPGNGKQCDGKWEYHLSQCGQSEKLVLPLKLRKAKHIN